MKKHLKVLVLLLTVIFLVAGCSGKDPSANKEGNFFTDSLGREVEIADIPERAISVSPAITEILFAIGLEDRIFGVTSYCEYPEAALDKPKIGDFANPNIELIVEAEPDIVFLAAGVQTGAIKKLEDLGIIVFCLDAENIDQILANIKLTGEIMGVSENANTLVAELELKIEEVSSKVKDQEKPGVFFEVFNEPLMSTGPDTFINSMIEYAGGKNILADADTQFPQVSLEVLVERDPEVYIANDAHNYTVDIKSRPGYQSLQAVKNDRVYTIENNLVTLPGPRAVLGIEEMAKAIHPDVFK